MPPCDLRVIRALIVEASDELAHSDHPSSERYLAGLSSRLRNAVFELERDVSDRLHEMADRVGAEVRR